eukprot:CAMPEP_0175159244 /NCGR_PEP_ID=MMETSP0087-20121206/23298_1 /TAXON_ID=136419 /ORGANISM="Unknown Unknown, Strain D1" /LENGTH=376 /DNA_ID=CAMNT_0016447239 /DNA_START=34 /DNA_END=1164 /DNA_ORIENTATION=+
MVDGMETLPAPQGATGAYPGGCFLSYLPVAGQFVNHGRVPHGEGVITLAVDHARRSMVGLTWPRGLLVRCDMHPAPTASASASPSSSTEPQLLTQQPPGQKNMWMFDYPGRGEGESVHPSSGQYRCVCRSLAVDPRTGCAYWSNTKGDVLMLDPNTGDGGKVSVLLSGEEGLVRDYFGSWDPEAPGTMAYHWRQVQWVEGYRGGCIVGIHGNTGYLFELFVPGPGQKPTSAKLQLVDRITSLPSRTCGMEDQFSYGYLGFAVAGPENNPVVFYLTGAPKFGYDGRRIAGKASTAKGESKGDEHLHLVTFQLASRTYRDHGPIFFRDRPGYPTYCNSLAVDYNQNRLYALARLPNGRTDLFRIPIPAEVSCQVQPLP